ncbi:TPA: hypothetical protein ACXE8V_001108 [Pluralibacter gergoviae]
MEVKDFITWLHKAPQDATVQVVWHTSGVNYYDQGGNVEVIDFSPQPASKENNYNQHFEIYTDQNNKTTLLLGSTGN